MPQSANNSAPTGGVTSPIMQFRTTTTPKCTGSIPMASANGMTIGTNSMILTLGIRHATEEQETAG